MERRDYLQKQVDQLGKVLGKILSDLLVLKSPAQVSEGIVMANQTLEKESGLDMEELMDIPAAHFIDVLTTEKQVNPENLEKLADILLFMAEHTEHNEKDNNRQKIIYQKCLIIYEYLTGKEHSYSFDWHMKIEKIKKNMDK